MRRVALAAAFALSAVAIAAGSAGSATSKSSFDVFVEETSSAAANGVVLKSALEGKFSVAGKTATGEGMYEVWIGSEMVEHGIFELTGLVSFQFYGCGEVTTPEGRVTLKPDFCGGRATFTVHAMSSTGEQAEGLYEVNCQIHDPGGQAPPGTSEGVKVVARGITFNRHLTGDNLFVMEP